MARRRPPPQEDVSPPSPSSRKKLHPSSAGRTTSASETPPRQSGDRRFKEPMRKPGIRMSLPNNMLEKDISEHRLAVKLLRRIQLKDRAGLQDLLESANNNDVDEYTVYGLGMLGAAVIEDSLEIVKYLINEGANPNMLYTSRDEEERPTGPTITPFMWAAQRGSAEIVSFLLDPNRAGVQVDHTIYNSLNRSGLGYAIEQSRFDVAEVILNELSKLPPLWSDKILNLVEQPTAETVGATPLVMAIVQGAKANFVRLLLETGANASVGTCIYGIEYSSALALAKYYNASAAEVLQYCKSHAKAAQRRLPFTHIFVRTYNDFVQGCVERVQ